MSLDILYEDNHLLVVNKPAGLPTQGAAAGEDSVVARARKYLKEKYHKPGNVYVGVVSRLDAAVTGVVVLARTSKSAARLSEQFRETAVTKTYWAVVESMPKQRTGTLVDRLEKDERQRKVIVVDAGGGQEARLRFRQLASLDPGQTLLEIHLETGRKHQIRVQLAHYGCPIAGDTKYGALQPFPKGIALHARRLEIAHPTQKTRLEFVAPLPKSWRWLDLDEEKAKKLENKPPK
jgi:23S rRNA pseudouridine1911/1915/1917 synthase